MWSRSTVAALSALLASLALAGCTLLGGGDGAEEAASPPEDSSAVAGARGVPRATPVELPSSFTNENWDLAVEDPERYRGTPVDITGEVFNVLGDSEGFHRFQMYTDPQTANGNTHVAVEDDPRVKRGYQVRVEGVISGLRVARAVSGRELRVVEVEAQSVTVIGPPSVVTPTAIPSPTAEPSPTRMPTAAPTSVPATPVQPTPTLRPATPVPSTPTVRPTTPTPPMATAVPTREAASTRTATPAPTQPPRPTAPPAATALPTAPPTVAAPPTAPPTAEVVSVVDAPIIVSAGSLAPSGPMTVQEDAGAPSGQYLTTTESDQGWDGTGAPPDTGDATLQIEVPRDGTYAVWARMWYEGLEANSVWLAVDDQPAIKVGNEDDGYWQWKWVGWQEGSTADRITLELEAGSHTLRLLGREAGTRVDSILLTDDLSYQPE